MHTISTRVQEIITANTQPLHAQLVGLQPAEAGKWGTQFTQAVDQLARLHTVAGQPAVGHTPHLGPSNKESTSSQAQSLQPCLATTKGPPVDELVLAHKGLGEAVGVLALELAEALAEEGVVPATGRENNQRLSVH